MKYLKLFNESKVVGRDLTNLYYDVYMHKWTSSSHILHWYECIEKKFGINKDELSWILSEFVEDFDLLFSCTIDDDTICVRFFPYVYLTNMPTETEVLMNINFEKWIKDKGEFAGIFYSMNERLLDYGLTIKLEKDVDRYIDVDYIDDDDDDDDDLTGEVTPLPGYDFKIYDYRIEHSMKLIIKRKR